MNSDDDFPDALCDAIEALLEAQANRSHDAHDLHDDNGAVEVAHGVLVDEIRKFAQACAEGARADLPALLRLAAAAAKAGPLVENNHGHMVAMLDPNHAEAAEFNAALAALTKAPAKQR